MKRGKTPVLQPDEVRLLIDSIDTSAVGCCRARETDQYVQLDILIIMTSVALWQVAVSEALFSPDVVGVGLAACLTYYAWSSGGPQTGTEEKAMLETLSVRPRIC